MRPRHCPAHRDVAPRTAQIRDLSKVIDAETDEQHMTIAEEVEARLAHLEAYIDSVRQDAIKHGEHNDELEQELQDEYYQEAALIRKQAFKKSRNVES